ncbi:aerotolerance regulator BatC [Bacteroides sp. 214]|uniref:tetratricopeptide repeat protein n=1 Tax=Bacteroides sp. 214 TaxID=2302935 RepID=UPI0013D8CF4F|nr:tetratricopeptide repeat protein [Bacteroides sp. 214]NDW12945.1 aerotolerance regulator BatC [Bacteroides sp. 214]
MLANRYIVFSLLVAISISVTAQKAEREHIRKGNRQFNDSTFVDAEVSYRKALEVNPKSTISMYNLGNSLTNQHKFQEAMDQYQAAADIEKDKSKLAQIYHNAGVIFMAGKDYAKAVEGFKQSLRNNPTDDETRYNLALAQKLLEQQQQDQQNQDQNQDQQEQEQQEQENEKNQEQQQNQDQQEQQEQEQQQQPQENEMSKENAEQMLNSVMQDEKEVQEKVKQKQQVLQGRRLEKEW